MLDAIHHGITAIHQGVDRLNKAGERIARDGAGGDLAGNVVDLMRARHEVKAGTAVVKTADETIGSLLDVFA